MHEDAGHKWSWNAVIWSVVVGFGWCCNGRVLSGLTASNCWNVWQPVFFQ